MPNRGTLEACTPRNELHEINIRLDSKCCQCCDSLRCAYFSRLEKAKPIMGDQIQPSSFYSMWDAVARFAQEIRATDFMGAMIRRRDADGSEGVMGALDCATLYGLTRWLQPAVVVESGGFIGMSSAFILKALADEELTKAKLYSIEWSEECEHGALIPEELRSASGGFVPMRGKVEALLKRDQLPRCIDMFLHDSSHSYRHMLWEFRQFSPRLFDDGLLVSQHVQMNAAFSE